VRSADGVVWFEFHDLCGSPRAARDYIEIARCFNTGLIGNIPLMDDRHNDHAKRFIVLVDEFYDRNVKLIVSAAADPEHLYAGARLTDSFRRTSSRLQEMCTHEYLGRQHLP
jgi:cell division protein ZapE